MSYSPWGHRVGHDLPINQQRHTHRKGGERQLEENSLRKSRLFFFFFKVNGQGERAQKTCRWQITRVSLQSDGMSQGRPSPGLLWPGFKNQIPAWNFAFDSGFPLSVGHTAQ